MNKLTQVIVINFLVITIAIISLLTLGFKPYEVNTYEMNNGVRTIIFQEMVHVGEEKFYNKINKKITDYKSEGYTYYYEMIKIKNKEDLFKMSKLMGLNSPKINSIIHSSNLEKQASFLLKSDPNDIHADIYSDQLIEMLEANYNINKKPEVPDLGIENFSLDIIPKSDKYSEFVSRSLFRFALRSSMFFNADALNIDQVIINQRNDILITKISQNTHDKIFIQYGQKHFKDFKEQMEKQGYKTKIIDTSVVF